jgi:long-chain acyl-CoA synthetase
MKNTNTAFEIVLRVNLVFWKNLPIRREGDISSLPKFKAESEEMVEMLYTGGTTGLPKGVPFTNILFMESVAEQRQMSEDFIPKGEDIVIQGGPLFHILGQAVGLGGVLSGDTLVLLPRVILDGLFDHIQRYRVLTLLTSRHVPNDS